MGRGRKPNKDSVDIPTPSKHHAYPLPPYPLRLNPLKKEVFFNSKKLDDIRSREQYQVFFTKRMNESPYARMRLVLYLLKVGAVLEKQGELLRTTGRCDLSELARYIVVSNAKRRDMSYDDMYFASALHINGALLELRTYLQHMVTTIHLTDLGAVSNTLGWTTKASRKSPSEG